MKLFFVLIFFFVVSASSVLAQSPTPATTLGGETIMELLRLFMKDHPVPQGDTPENLPDGTSTITPAVDETAVISTGGKDGFVFYCQGNPAWLHVCHLGEAGCGPTSMAMVLSTLFQSPITPPEVDKVFQKNGWRSCSNAGSHMTSAIGSKWLKDEVKAKVGPNLAYNGTLDLKQAKEFLNNGALIIGSSKNYPCANCKSAKRIDHIFVVDDVNPSSGTVSIRDPNNCSYTNGNDENQARREKGVSEFTWFYAFPINR